MSNKWCGLYECFMDDVSMVIDGECEVCDDCEHCEYYEEVWRGCK